MPADPLTFFLIATALLVIGEALLLWIGVVVRQPDSPWVTNVVRGLLVTDIVSGAALAASVDSPILIVPAATVIAVTHAYRAWEVLAGRPERFCFNTALFVLNGVKLLGAAAVFLLLFRSL